jgi:hypothetical protein
MPKSPPLKNTKRLWAAMCDLVSENDGWITSIPNEADIRMETPINSDLPSLLEGLGYQLSCLGTGERCLPVGSGVAPATVEIYSFQMPQLLAEKRSKAIP